MESFIQPAYTSLACLGVIRYCICFALLLRIRKRINHALGHEKDEQETAVIWIERHVEGLSLTIQLSLLFFNRCLSSRYDTPSFCTNSTISSSLFLYISYYYLLWWLSIPHQTLSSLPFHYLSMFLYLRRFGSTCPDEMRQMRKYTTLKPWWLDRATEYYYCGAIIVNMRLPPFVP